MAYKFNPLTGALDLVKATVQLVASAVSYDNSTSGLTATNVQDAIDELSEDDDCLDGGLANSTYTPDQCFDGGGA